MQLTFKTEQTEILKKMGEFAVRFIVLHILLHNIGTIFKVKIFRTSMKNENYCIIMDTKEAMIPSKSYLFSEKL